MACVGAGLEREGGMKVVWGGCEEKMEGDEPPPTAMLVLCTPMRTRWKIAHVCPVRAALHCLVFLTYSGLFAQRSLRFVLNGADASDACPARLLTQSTLDSRLIAIQYQRLNPHVLNHLSDMPVKKYRHGIAL